MIFPPVRFLEYNTADYQRIQVEDRHLKCIEQFSPTFVIFKYLGF